MEKDSVMKMSDAGNPPKNPPIFKSEAVKKRYSHAKSMALDALSLPKIERFNEPIEHTLTRALHTFQYTYHCSKIVKMTYLPWEVVHI